MVFVTAIHMTAPGTSHEHIEQIRWLNCGDSTSRTMTKERAVEWLRKGNRMQVADAEGAVDVRVVEADTPYIRTVADGRFTDNLLSLPRF